MVRAAGARAVLWLGVLSHSFHAAHVLGARHRVGRGSARDAWFPPPPPVGLARIHLAPRPPPSPARPHAPAAPYRVEHVVRIIPASPSNHTRTVPIWLAEDETPQSVARHHRGAGLFFQLRGDFHHSADAAFHSGCPRRWSPKGCLSNRKLADYLQGKWIPSAHGATYQGRGHFFNFNTSRSEMDLERGNGTELGRPVQNATDILRDFVKYVRGLPLHAVPPEVVHLLQPRPLDRTEEDYWPGANVPRSYFKPPSFLTADHHHADLERKWRPFRLVDKASGAPVQWSPYVRFDGEYVDPPEDTFAICHGAYQKCTPTCRVKALREALQGASPPPWLERAVKQKEACLQEARLAGWVQHHVSEVKQYEGLIGLLGMLGILLACVARALWWQLLRFCRSVHRAGGGHQEEVRNIYVQQQLNELAVETATATLRQQETPAPGSSITQALAAIMPRDALRVLQSQFLSLRRHQQLRPFERHRQPAPLQRLRAMLVPPTPAEAQDQFRAKTPMPLLSRMEMANPRGIFED